MKSIKIGLTALLTACAMLGALCTGSLPAGIMTKSAVIAAVADELVYQGLKYEIADGAVTITGYTQDLPAEAVIPAEIDGVPVTGIGYRAFYENENLISITIPEGVTGIGIDAFAFCSNLTGIMIPEGVTGIDDCAFYRCRQLTGITLPDSLTGIGSYAFERSGLTSVTIPKGVTRIGNSAFAYSKLTSIIVPDSVTGIGEQAFSYCEALKEITILNPTCEIWDSPFTVSNTNDKNGKPVFGGIIRGYADSAAQAYADKYGYTFISLGERPAAQNGDINGDGELTVSDAVSLLRFITGEAAEEPLETAAADLNSDGIVDLLDLRALLRLLNE